MSNEQREADQNSAICDIAREIEAVTGKRAMSIAGRYYDEASTKCHRTKAHHALTLLAAKCYGKSFEYDTEDGFVLTCFVEMFNLMNLSHAAYCMGYDDGKRSRKGV